MKTRSWALLLGAVFVLLCLCAAALLMPRGTAGQAEIWSEGRLVQTVDLRRDTVIEVESAHGSNTVTIRDGAISVTAASCPDHYCMDRGPCASGPAIICLPNQLVIQFQAAPDWDAKAG